MCDGPRTRDIAGMSHTVSLAPATPDPSSAAGTIRVVIADAQPWARADVSTLLEHEPGITVVGEAASGDEAVGLVDDTRPDVVLLDSGVPDDCVQATRRMLAAASVTVVVMAQTEMDSRVFAAMRAGASRRLVKDGDRRRLVRAVRQCGWSNRHRAGRPRAVRHFTTPNVVELLARDAGRRGER